MDCRSEAVEEAREVGIDLIATPFKGPGDYKTKDLHYTDKSYKNRSFMRVYENKRTDGSSEFFAVMSTRKHGGRQTKARLFDNGLIKEDQSIRRDTAKIKRGLLKHNVEKKASGKVNKMDYLEAFKHAAQASPENEYLIRKGISEAINLRGARAMKDWKGEFLAFPYFDRKGNLAKVHRYYANGEKWISPGEMPKGIHAVIPKKEDGPDEIYLAEGMGAALSVHLMTGAMVYDCFSADNMEGVADYVVAKHPTAKIIIAGDWDISEKGNTGAYKAYKIAFKHGLSLALPKGDKRKDWNDIHTDLGTQKARQLLEKALEKPKKMSKFEQNQILLKYAYAANMNEILLEMARELGFGSMFTSEDLVTEFLVDRAGGRIEKDKVRALLQGELKSLRKSLWRYVNVPSGKVDGYHSFDTVLNDQGHSVISEETAELFKELLSSGAIVLVKAPMGTGKTSLLVKGALGKWGSAAVMCPRVSLIDSMAGELDLLHYKMVNADSLKDNSKIINCVNSFAAGRFESGDYNWHDDLNLLIFDEISACLEQITSIGSRKMKEKNFFAAKRAIESASMIAGFDADLNQTTIASLRNITGKAIHVIEVKIPREQKIPFRVKATFCAETNRRELERALWNEKKCLVATDSATRARVLEKQIRTSFPDHRVLCVTANPSEAEAEHVYAFQENPNEKMLEYDVVIYSPVITSGISIVGEHFEKHFGFFSGVIPFTHMLQMIGRDRTAQLWNLFVKKNSPRESSSITRANQLRGVLGFGLTNTSYTNHKFGWERHTDQTSRDAAKKLLVALGMKGHQISPMKTITAEMRKEMRKDSKEVKAEIKSQWHQMIINSEMASEREYGHLKCHPFRSEPEEAKVIAYEISEQLCIERDPKTIEFHARGAFSKVKNYEFFKTDPDALLALDKREKEDGFDAASLSLASMKQEFFHTVCSLLGLSDDFTREFRAEDCKRVLDYALQISDKINYMFAKTLISKDKPPRCPTSFVKRILSLLGIELGLRKSNGKKIRFIKKESLLFMDEILTKRLDKGLSFVQRSEDGDEHSMGAA